MLLEGVDVLVNYHSRLLLLDYLLSELMAARLTGGKQEEEMVTGQEVSHPDHPVWCVYCACMQGGSIENSLSAILRVYDIKQPPTDVTVKQVFDKIIGTVSLTTHTPSLFTHSHRLVRQCLRSHVVPV